MPNELTPANDPGQAGGSGTPPHAERSHTGLKSVEEIAQAIDQLSAWLAMRIINERMFSAMLQGLRVQLECAKQAAKGGAVATGDGDVGPLVELIERDPDALRKIAPSINPDSLQEIVRRMKK
jgi:hypothetical protein